MKPVITYWPRFRTLEEAEAMAKKLRESDWPPFDWICGTVPMCLTEHEGGKIYWRRNPEYDNAPYELSLVNARMHIEHHIDRK